MSGSDPLLARPGLAIVIMGVSGCGKSTVAALLAEALGCSFIEADDYHSQENKSEDEQGHPALRRRPHAMAGVPPGRHPGSAGPRRERGRQLLGAAEYREVLRAADRSYKPGDYATCRVKFVCLRASAEVITERMQRRSSEGKHFMPASLLQSQLDLLQIHAAEGITEVDATVRACDIVCDTVAQFREELASTFPPPF